MNDAERFLNALAWKMPASERLILCGFVGDPDKAEPGDWRPRPWRPGAPIPFGPKANGYVTISSFGRADDGSFRRRAGLFAAGRALMVDDVGTKVPTSSMTDTAPSAIIETSPGNHQYWYLLSEPERDPERLDGIIRAFIAGKLLGADPGMSGITRVGRLPGFQNAKPKYGGFETAFRLFEPKRRFTVESLLSAFNLRIEGRRPAIRKIPSEIARSRVEAYFTIEEYLRRRNMLKRSKADLSGWTEMHCPWVDEHTGGADTGAAIREPAPDNQYYGAFRCHHGHCADRGWSQLTEWIADQAADNLADRNRAAPATLAEALRR